jgi:hypothetical protein
MTGYDVITPDRSQRRTGFEYQDMIEAWAYWLFSEDLDIKNDGPIVYLRGIDFPPSPDQRSYNGQPVVRLGLRSLQMSDDQALFLAVICTAADEIDDRARTLRERINIVWQAIKRGDNPPSKDQVMVDGSPLKINGNDLREFQVYSRDFILHVPSISYGRSLKDFLDIPISTAGDRRVVVGGYFVVLKFEKHQKPESHTVVFQGKGPNGYIASGVYRINVVPSEIGLGTRTAFPDNAVFRSLLQQVTKRFNDLEIDEVEYNEIKENFGAQ